MRVSLDLPAELLRFEAPTPARISQLTVQSYLGLDRRRFVDLSRKFAAAGGHVLHVGKLRLVEPQPFIEWLRSRSEPQHAQPNDDRDDLGSLLKASGLRAAE